MSKSYTSSVVLRVGGEGVDPQWVTGCLDLEPHRAVGRYEPMASADREGAVAPSPAPLHPTGSWRRYPPPELAARPMEEQVQYWIELLDSRHRGLIELRDAGLVPALSCFVDTDTVASVVLSNHQVAVLAELGLDLELSIFARTEAEDEPTDGGRRVSSGRGDG